ncbi:VC0807 family protein, partial [Burkholderia cepacia]|uniref:VC0807 family protein n=1 Tax=Burkholderia cepacia TaxID=292 RepID=UPI003132E6AB
MKIRVAFVAELAVNFVLPWVVYRLALPSWGESGALYASAVPPLLWGIVEFARTRRVDALSAIALLGIALSIALMAGGGSPRLLLVRESFVSGTIGVVFLVSLVFKRPITYYLTRETVARQGEGGVER